MSNEEKFANVPAEELAEYVKNSEHQAGETDDQWARRVERAESDLLAKYKDAPPVASAAAPDAPLADGETVPEPSEEPS